MSSETHQQRRTRVDGLAKRTGKPHFYVDPSAGEKGKPGWLWAGRSRPQEGEVVWSFVDHLERVYGWD